MSALPVDSPRNLEQQHKLAKDLLRAAIAGNPGALSRIRAHRSDVQTPTLADAQLTIAREAGFSSWPKFVAHVEQVETDARLGLLFPRCTDRARKALFVARYQAAALGSETIEPEHLLLGLLGDVVKLSTDLSILQRVSYDGLCRQIQARTTARDRLPTSRMIPFSDETKSALLFASEETERLHHDMVGPAHLLLGLLRAKASVAAQLLAGYGVTLAAVRASL